MKKMDSVFVDYEYKVNGKVKKVQLKGLVDRIYITTFGGCRKGKGVSILLEKAHPVTGDYRVTFSIDKVHLKKA